MESALIHKSYPLRNDYIHVIIEATLSTISENNIKVS